MAGAVLTTRAQAQALARTPDAFECVIDVDQFVELRGPADARIAAVLVRRGDKVRAGQTLVPLEAVRRRGF